MNTTIRLNTPLIQSLCDVLLISPSKAIDDTGIARSTWYYIMDHPDKISIQQLLAFANGLHVPVRRFFSTEKADLVGKREDYVMEPYIECQYDDAAMQEMVSANPSTTWKKAAKATGMSRSRSRDSLLAITRTPVVRFLTACESFKVDPFKILIDPNPEVKKKHSSDNPVRTEVAALCQQVGILSDRLKELTAKYDELLQRHNTLLDRHNELEQKISNYFGSEQPLMAAEDDPGDGKQLL